MTVTRRELLKAGAAASAVAMLPGGARAAFAPVPGTWRTFELITRIELPAGSARAQVWVPVPAIEADWIRPGEATWTTTATEAGLAADPVYGAKFLHAVWEGEGPRTLEVTARVATQSRAVDLGRPASAPALSEADRALYTRGTALIPVDGIVLETAEGIVAGATGDVEKARAIYDWVVVNTARNPETRGCGLGDIATMLMSGDLSGKCADLNALYVGLARAAGLPARDVYGLRVAPSAFGYKSIGAASETVTKSQHCRAEVYLSDFGWVPVDPADVRKVMLEEPPGNLALDDPKVADVRAGLFGGWEGNWIGYNVAHDVALPGAEAGEVEFLMYPQGELDGMRLDPLDPDDFTYAITAREVAG